MIPESVCGLQRRTASRKLLLCVPKPRAFLMQWSDVVADSNLRDLPYKIELNENGQLVMTPHAVEHSLLQGDIEAELRRHLPNGRVAPELAIRTSKGTKSADVVWGSDARFAEIRDLGGDDAQIAPEICVEILSKSNTLAEMEAKRLLYFEAGAQEFWLCSQTGQMRFFDRGGELTQSALAPHFPRQVRS
jgi:Uma2 family endonuclease